MRCWRISILIYFCFLWFVGPVSANPIPDTSPLPKVWDNLYGTAGEPLSLYDVYLVAPQKLRIALLFDPVRTTNYWNADGKSDNLGSLFSFIHSPKIYSRSNLPFSIAYGIAQSFEIEFRRAFVSRSRIIPYLPESLLVEPYWNRYETTKGLGDISLRLRVKILGEQTKFFYFATGIGIKFASSAEFKQTDDLPISPGSTDIFFGIYNAIKLGRFILPSFCTYSHTGRYQSTMPMGEIITYRIGLIANIHRFLDFNFNLQGYEITKQSGLSYRYLTVGTFDKSAVIIPQEVHKTQIGWGLTVRGFKLPAVISLGLAYDLRGKKTFKNTFSANASLQIDFH
ncbi:MAG: hypothetical protein ABIK67_00085 [candidate division WOR-3 bacterium]